MNDQFAEKIFPFLSDLRQHCLRLAFGSAWDSEDLVQETLIKVHRALLQFPDRAINKSYLRRIATNIWIDEYRKNKTISEPHPDVGQDVASSDNSFLILETIELLAGRLTALQTVLVILVDTFSFTAKETAILIESTEGAVKEALKRARRRLIQVKSTNEKYVENPKNDFQTTQWYNALLDGFHTGNPYAICNSYLTLTNNGVAIVEINRTQDIFYFMFRDPNGHLLGFTSKIIF